MRQDYTGQLEHLDIKTWVELFRSMPEEAIWFNPQNSAQHRNLADAFELRLFNARITKVSNPQNLEIMDIYSASQKEGLIKSMQIEQELIEFEHNLWEFLKAYLDFTLHNTHQKGGFMPPSVVLWARPFDDLRVAKKK